MAEETPSPPSQAGKGIGSKLTKKLGPLPVWGWAIVGGAVLVVVYRWYSAKNAAASAATTAATAPTTGTTGLGSADTGAGAGGGSSGAGNGYNDGGTGQLAAILAQLQSQGIGATSAGPGTAPAVGKYQGGGFWPQSGPGGYETAAGTTYQNVTTSAAVDELLASGQQLFIQPVQGIFVPYTGGPSGQGNIPIYVQSPFTGPAANVSGAGGSASPVGGTAGPPAPIVPPGRPGVNPPGTIGQPGPGNGPATGIQSRPPAGIATRV